MPNKNEKMRFWATVSIDGWHIRDVVAAEGLEMATTLLTSNYSARLKEMFQVKPVTVTVDDDGSGPRSTS